MIISRVIISTNDVLASKIGLVYQHKVCIYFALCSCKDWVLLSFVTGKTCQATLTVPASKSNHPPPSPTCLHSSLDTDRIPLLLQRFVQLFLGEETVRVITAGNAILQKSHMFEVLLDLQNSAAAVATASTESQQVGCRICKYTQLHTVSQRRQPARAQWVLKFDRGVAAECFGEPPDWRKT